MALDASQVVDAEPGVLGVKVIVALPVMLALVIAAVGAVQARAGGARMVICDWPAATAEFM